MDIQMELNERANQINRILESYLPEEEGCQTVLFAAMNYSIRVGGKRIRPILMHETFQMFHGTSKAIEPFMAAIEMIHTYSLVHDDLPAMDNDMYRRGNLTTHAKYGEDMGILTGDGLLNLAYETVAKAFLLEPENPNIGKAFHILATKAGIFGMVGGQVVDVMSDKENRKNISREKLDFIYELKTSALIEASMMVGAVLAGASDEQVMKVEVMAKKVGLAFQIQDDILDVTGTLEELGKPVGSDEKNQKPTYVTFEGIEKASADVERLSMEAIATLDELQADGSFLKNVFLFLIHRKK